MEETKGISKYHDDMVESFIAITKGEEPPPVEDFNGIKELEYYKRVHRILLEYYKTFSSPEEVDPKVEEELLNWYLTVLGKRPITTLCSSCKSTDLKEVDEFDIFQGCE